ncbi:MAG: M48 family metalloprotease [Gammaproteobacteria bacterium]|nr:M48 family metalloprotease [Gammaproteobacteria bacterium]
MHPFAQIFVALLTITTLAGLYLSFRQYRSVQNSRSEVPDEFASKISLEDHQKAADYTTAKLKLGSIESLYGVVWLLIWTFGSGLEWLDQQWYSLQLAPIWQGVGVMLSFMITLSIVSIPFSIYSTFRLEQRFGFNQTTIKTFVSDLIKQSLLSIAIGTPLLALVLWLMNESGPQWWLYVWATWFGFSLFMMWAYPSFIAPIFNKFSPLDNEELVQRIKTLMSRCGFHSSGIFVMDGSKRSRHGNAYFTGLGRNKRIVFFDTLLEELNDDEIEAVLAHELGHFHHKHILKRLVQIGLISLGSLALLGWLAEQSWFYNALGVSTASSHQALILFMLVMPLFGFFVQPLMAAGSRKHEYEADSFAAEKSSATDLVNALVKLYQENANTLTPDAIYSAFHDSHPPAPVRIAYLNQLAGSVGQKK